MDSIEPVNETLLGVLQLVFDDFQVSAERYGSGDLILDEGRMLQVAVRYESEEQKDFAEHRIKKINSARSAAIWATEIMRASPILATYRAELPENVRTFRGRVNAWFSLYFSCAWMGLPNNGEDTISPLASSMLIDALQFRSGCRHTLAVVFLSMLDSVEESALGEGPRNG